MADEMNERTTIMKLRVEPATQEILRDLAAGEKSMGKLLDELAPALVAERHHIDSGGADRSPVTAVIRRAMLAREEKKGQWTKDEFRLLLANEHLSDEALASRLDRSPGAVGVVRVGVQRWRNGSDNKGILSKVMLEILEEGNQAAGEPK